MRTVYLAGAIDGDTGRVHELGWRHNPDLRSVKGVEWWCPVCEYDRGNPTRVTMGNNMQALFRSDAVIVHWNWRVASFGTPIEVWEYTRLMAGGLPKVCVINESARTGLFLDFLYERGMIKIVATVEEAAAWLLLYLKSSSL